MAVRSQLNIEGKRVGSQNNLKYQTEGNAPTTQVRFVNASNQLRNSDPYNGLLRTGQELVDGGTDTTKKIIRCLFDRNGISVGNLQMKMTINVQHAVEGDLDIYQYKFEKTFLNGTSTLSNGNAYDTTTSQGLANFWISEFYLTTWLDTLSDTELSIPNSTGMQIFAEDGTTLLDYAANPVNSAYSHGGGYAFKLKCSGTNDSMRNFDSQYIISGTVILQRFMNVPAYRVGNLDYITKDIDFGFPGIRKKIYKVIITYRSPVKMMTTGGEDGYSNMQPSFAINGGMALRLTETSGTNPYTNTDWYLFNVTNLPSTTEDSVSGNIPDMGWIRQELKPATNIDSSIWNNVYSLAIRIKSIGVVKGFEINDISIVYRQKGIK